MSKITVTITGDSMADVHNAIIALATEVGGENVRSVALATDANEAKVEVGQADTMADAEPEKEPEKEPEAQPEGVMQDLSDEDALKTGIDEVQKHFAAHPESLPEITNLQKKYGVKMFVDIDPKKAHDFLADVRLMVSGAATADA